MKKFLAFLFAIMIATPVFATVINNNSATCDGNTLGVTSGSVRLRAKYAPETINLKWYDSDGNTTTTNTCTYDGGLTLPTQPTKSGYTFKGWRVINYTPIEYIESTGTQYIDTGIYDVTDSEFGIVAQQTEIMPSGGYPTIVGATDDAQGYKWVVSYGSGEFSQCAGPGNYINFGHIIMDLNKHTYKVINTTNSQTVVIDNNASKTKNYPITNTTQVSLTICARHTQSNVEAYTKQRVYSFYAKKNGVLIRDMIPVKDSNGVACMYDKVSGQFFYNAGTGNFIAGPDL